MTFKATRKLTQEQFAANTTVDGNRLECALDDSVNRGNEVPLADNRTRFMPRTIVLKYDPAEVVGSPDSVFLPLLNSAATTDGLVPPAAGYDNALRVKGGDPSAFCWTIPLDFENPVVLVEVIFFVLTDTFYGGNTSKPVHAQVDVDDVWASEDRLLNSVVFTRRSTPGASTSLANAEGFGSLYDTGVLTFAADALPNVGAGNQVDGLCIWSRDLSEPVHASARWRVRVEIGTGPEDYVYCVAVTVLEEIQ